MTISTKYNIGDLVHLVTDEDQEYRMVTAIKVLPNNCITYLLNLGIQEAWHFEVEISAERNILKTL